MKYICNICGYIYDEDLEDIIYDLKAIKWENLDDNFECPLCSMPKDVFSLIEEK